MKNLVEKNATVTLDKAFNGLSVSLSGFVSLENMQRISTYEWAMIQHYQVKKCLVNLREMGIYAPGVTAFINNQWFPKVQQLGLTHLAFVVPDSAFGKASMNKAHELTSQPNWMVIEHFSDQSSAQQWLQEIDQLLVE